MLLSLADVDPAQAGGKGAALRKLQDHGFPVPRTWVLPFEAFQKFLNHHQLQKLVWTEQWEELERRILSEPLPFLIPIPAPLVAVRSSAGDEDGKEGSAAGQYSSVLSVGPERLEAAVRICWASYYGSRARAYRKEMPGEARMAVLIQQMVDARVAGVAFTINPLTGSWREMPVEAVWGLGEGLVGGQTVPDRYVVRRPRHTPPIPGLISQLQLELESETITPQADQIVAGRDGIKTVHSEAPLGRKLVREELFELCRLGLRVEDKMGEPQDLEWVQDRGGAFWVLQSRPITARGRLPRGGSTLWTRRFIGERWPEGSSVLGWSIIAPVLEWFIAYPETSNRYLGGDPPLRLVRGHPYLNVTVFRHLAFKLPGRPPPQFMLEFFPADEAEHWLRRLSAAPDFRVYASIFATTFREQRWQRFRWNPFRNHRAWQEFRKGLEPRLERLRQAAPEKVLEEATPLIRDYIKVHITSLLFANLYYQIVAPLVPAEDKEILLRPPAGTITLQVNRDLWRLAHDPELLPSVLKEHGHRSSASWEIFSRRWVESPEEVLRLAMLWRDRPDPRLLVEEEDRQTEKAMKKIQHPLLRRAVLLTQAYLGLREEQRYHFDRILLLLKQKLCQLGKGLSDPEEIRFLERGELSLPPERWPELIAARRDLQPDPEPPTFLYGEEALPIPRSDSPRLQGLGISTGVVRGRTRVIRHLEQVSQLQPGEILVTRCTDPAWTPAFARAGGLILELGSLLSHGAVVAREYHLPGVVNVAGAMERLPTGTEVVIDGRSGGVWVIHSTG